MALALAVSACDSGDGAALASRICDAADAAASGDVGAARESFEDNHAGLHALADVASETDRQAAARLLRAKQEVEAALATATATADDLALLLSDLAAATAIAEGREPPRCA